MVPIVNDKYKIEVYEDKTLDEFNDISLKKSEKN